MGLHTAGRALLTHCLVELALQQGRGSDSRVNKLQYKYSQQTVRYTDAGIHVIGCYVDHRMRIGACVSRERL